MTEVTKVYFIFQWEGAVWHSISQLNTVISRPIPRQCVITISERKPSWALLRFLESNISTQWNFMFWSKRKCKFNFEENIQTTLLSLFSQHRTEEMYGAFSSPHRIIPHPITAMNTCGKNTQTMLNWHFGCQAATFCVWLNNTFSLKYTFKGKS